MATLRVSVAPLHCSFGLETAFGENKMVSRVTWLVCSSHPGTAAWGGGVTGDGGARESPAHPLFIEHLGKAFLAFAFLPSAPMCFPPPFPTVWVGGATRWCGVHDDDPGERDVEGGKYTYIFLFPILGHRSGRREERWEESRAIMNGWKKNHGKLALRMSQRPPRHDFALPWNVVCRRCWEPFPSLPSILAPQWPPPALGRRASLRYPLFIKGLKVWGSINTGAFLSSDLGNSVTWPSLSRASCGNWGDNCLHGFLADTVALFSLLPSLLLLPNYGAFQGIKRNPFDVFLMICFWET